MNREKSFHRLSASVKLQKRFYIFMVKTLKDITNHSLKLAIMLSQ